MKKIDLVICLLIAFSSATIPRIVGSNDNQETNPPEITIINHLEGYFHF